MKVKKIILIIILILIIVACFFVFKMINNKTVNNENNVTNITEITNSVNIDRRDTTQTSQDDSDKSNKDVDIQIKDNYFMENMNDIYFNYNKYDGKTLSYEGFVYYDEQNPNAMVVARYYYCCGYDSFITGLECKYNGEKLEAKKWVKVTGIIKVNKDNAEDIYPYLDVTSLEFLSQPGNEYVKN